MVSYDNSIKYMHVIYEPTPLPMVHAYPLILAYTIALLMHYLHSLSTHMYRSTL